MDELLAAAIAELSVSDDWSAIARLQSLASDPGRLALLSGEEVAAFVEWKPGQSATGESGWVSAGGQFRKEKPQGTPDDGEDQRQKTAHAAEVFAKGALDGLPIAVRSNKGLMGRLKEKALDAAAVAYGKLVTATPLMQKALDLLMDATDDPRSDYGKLGYQPSLGGAGHETGDPVRAQLGISANLASTIAVKVIGTALYHFRKRVLGHFQGADQTDWFADAAKELADLYDAVGMAFGITGKTDPAKLADTLRAKAQDRAKTTKLADAPAPKPQVIQVKAAPATSEVALAGQDGAAFAKLLGQSKAFGVRKMAEVVGGAIKRYRGKGPLLTPPETKQLAEALAAVNSTSQLLGRTRVRERADRADVFKGSDGAPQDAPFASFADAMPGILATPEEAVAYFLSHRPELGIDPDRFGPMMRRHAFTLAQSTNQFLTQRVQGIIGDALKGNAATPDASAAIRQALSEAGVTPKNPQYAEMVFRTNAMDSFQQGMYEEGRSADVEDAFPCWEYLIVDDARTGEDHRPKGGRFYPAHAQFSAVRGDRPFNCRCSMRWCDKYEWAKREAQGARVESEW